MLYSDVLLYWMCVLWGFFFCRQHLLRLSGLMLGGVLALLIRQPLTVVSFSNLKPNHTRSRGLGGGGTVERNRKLEHTFCAESHR